MTVRYDSHGDVVVVTIERPAVRNAVDSATAAALSAAFDRYAGDGAAQVAILTGAGEHFCAGADLKAFASGHGNTLSPDGAGPMGPTRRLLDKPVIAAVEGYAVAGGLELALWCDLRVAGKGSTFGVFCRRFGVPLIDGGTVRLPRLIGLSRALDLIMTGRAVEGEEALAMGLVNRLVERGQALSAALTLARDLARLPQICLRHDRLSAYEQHGQPLVAALANEFTHGLASIASGEAQSGAARFTSGAGRHGQSS